MTTTRGRQFTTFVRHQATGLAVVLAAAGVIAASTAAVASAQAAPRPVRHVVVKVSERRHFGKIITTTRGRALYVTSTRCTGSCLSVWPPLLMPRGTNVPRGTSCLGTAKFGHRLQVTYRKKRLYLFVSDSGTSVTGNGVQGFFVARFSTRACPRR